MSVVATGGSSGAPSRQVIGPPGLGFGGRVQGSRTARSCGRQWSHPLGAVPDRGRLDTAPDVRAIGYHRLSSIRHERGQVNAAGGPCRQESRTMADSEAVQKARDRFLDDRHLFGCAEATLIALKEAYGLPEPGDSSAAMALNGGIAYSGGMCGAISGAAIALGLLAAQRIEGHGLAKRTARRLTARLMADFEERHGAVDCRDLIGVDLRTEEQHQAFLDSGIWRERCMRQIEFVVEALEPLAGAPAWEAAVGEVEQPW
jgi:C_GCAxxG_C_C family probable redox protein